MLCLAKQVKHNLAWIGRNGHAMVLVHIHAVNLCVQAVFRDAFQHSELQKGL